MGVRGTICSTQVAIEEGLTGYFQELYTTSEPTNIQDCTETLVRRVTFEMNAKLMAVFTKEEISKALHQMLPNKAPGPDGFFVAFYQYNWASVQGEVSDAILHFFF
jgi:hypothetical protein